MVQFDSSGHLIDYRLNKQSCGAIIGNESLLIDDLREKDISQILDFENRPVRPRNENRFAEYLRLKHLFALKSALEAFIGKRTGSSGKNCRVVEVIYDKNMLTFKAEFDFNIIGGNSRARNYCQSGCNLAGGVNGG